MKPFKVVCLGNVLVDVLVRPVDRFPPKGGLLPVDRVEMALGGCASNTALVLARLGVPVSLWGKIGRDRLGDLARQDLRREGVEVSGLLRDPGTTTSATVVLVDARGQRSFLHALAANDRTSLKDLRLSHLSRFDHLHIGGYFLFPRLDGAPMAKVLREAKSRGLTTSLDTAWDLKDRWMKALVPCLPHLDYFMPSEREVRKLLGHSDPRRAAKTFLGLGVGTFILKKGGRGSTLFTEGGAEVHAPAFRAKVVDTTGAGDCFCAGYLKGLSLGWSLGDCLRLGNAAGACAVGELGATAGIRSFRQVSRLL
jgi:sugar/nucleoside kinase (ribokinase family)